MAHIPVKLFNLYTYLYEKDVNPKNLLSENTVVHYFVRF